MRLPKIQVLTFLLPQCGRTAHAAHHENAKFKERIDLPIDDTGARPCASRSTQGGGHHMICFDRPVT